MTGSPQVINLTTETATTPKPKDWKTLQQWLRPQPAGERHPFFPISQVPSGQEIRLLVTGGPFFENLHGGYSIFEMDVQQGKIDHRLCVSGQRLASAISALEPGPGDLISLTPNGDGKGRTWLAKLA